MTEPKFKFKAQVSLDQAATQHYISGNVQLPQSLEIQMKCSVLYTDEREDSCLDSL